MCGIAGAFALDGRAGPPLDDDTLARMTDALRHRGPDDRGLVQRAGASIGARRLSIVDVAGGHQPLADEQRRVWAAQNGELYNHEQLRAVLERRGHRLRTRCDTEILPHLYEEHGPRLCERLHGKFAVAVWDDGERRGVLARDRLGVKPLYYARVCGVLLFASELRAIVASGLVRPALDPDALAAYLTLGFVPGPLTALRDVRKVLPGERLVVERGAVRAERYWRHPLPDPDPAPSVQEWAQRLLAELDEAVRRRLMSDVPVGAMLSGGLDSSLVVALMARHSRRPVPTFTIGLPGAGSELGDARRVAAALGAEHHELELPLAASRAALERVVWHLDEPVRSLSALGFDGLSELAATHVTVALSGQGADELLGGYRKHRVLAVVPAWRRLPAALRAAAAAAGRYGPAEVPRLVAALQAPDAGTRLLASSGLLRPDLRADLFSGALAEHAEAARRAVERHAHGLEGATPLQAGLHLDAQLGLVDDMLHYFDRVSMAHSLEVRVPFLDHRLVELCARMPDAVKVRRGATKRVLRLAAHGLVPDFVLAKRKLGFLGHEVDGWLRAAGPDVVGGLLLDPGARYTEVVERAAVAPVVRRWQQGDRGCAQFVLGLAVLETWLSTALPRAFAPARTAVAA